MASIRGSFDLKPQCISVFGITATAAPKAHDLKARGNARER
jgi:hypothetical protein